MSCATEIRSVIPKAGNANVLKRGRMNAGKNVATARVIPLGWNAVHLDLRYVENTVVMGCAMMPEMDVVRTKVAVENAVTAKLAAEIIVAKTDAMRQKMIVQIYARGLSVGTAKNVTLRTENANRIRIPVVGTLTRVAG